MAESKSRWQVECPLCRHGYATPKLLDCKHSFCLPCLENVVGFWKEATGEPQLKSIPCPRCREKFYIPNTGLSTLDDNEYIRWEDGSGEVRVIYCPNCDDEVHTREVTVLCRDCKQMYCKSCHKMHSGITAAESHTVTEISQTTKDKLPDGKTVQAMYIKMTRGKSNTNPEVNVLRRVHSEPGPSCPPSPSVQQEPASVSSVNPYANLRDQDPGEDTDGNDCGGDTLVLNPRSRPPPLPPRPRGTSRPYDTDQYAVQGQTQFPTTYAIGPGCAFSKFSVNNPPYMTPTDEAPYDDISVPIDSKPLVHAQSMPCLTGTIHRPILSPGPHYDVHMQIYDTRAVNGDLTARLQLKFKCSLRMVQSICVAPGGSVVMLSKRIKRLGAPSSRLQVFDANGQKQFEIPTDRHLISLAWFDNQEIVLASMEDSKVYKNRFLSKDLGATSRT